MAALKLTAHLLEGAEMYLSTSRCVFSNLAFEDWYSFLQSRLSAGCFNERKSPTKPFSIFGAMNLLLFLANIKTLGWSAIFQ